MKKVLSHVFFICVTKLPLGDGRKPFTQMKNKLLILALAAATMLIGCKKYDDTDVRNDIKDLQNRVTAL